MKAQSLPSLFLALLLLAVLPATAAELRLAQQAADFIRQAAQAAPVAQGVQVSAWEQGAASRPLAPLADVQRGLLFTLGGIRFNAMGSTPAAARAAEAGFHVTLFHLLNAISDQNPLLTDQDYVLRLNLPF